MRPVALVAVLALLPGWAPPGAAASDDLWTVTLQVEAADMTDTVTVGFEAGATPSFDAWVDRPEPPAPPGESYVRAFAQGDDGSADVRRLDRSMTGPTQTQSWDIRLEVGENVEQATLRWQGVASTTFAIELVHGESIFDLRAAGSVEVPVSGAPALLRVDAYQLIGEAPSPPRHLLALPGPSRGEVMLRWEPPVDDGGLPLRGYRLRYEGFDGEGWTRTLPLVTAFTDTHREVGSAGLYTIQAFNALASSDPSPPAVGIGTARERTLVPTGAPDERDEIARLALDPRPLVSARPQADVQTMANASDSRVTDIHVRAFDRELGVGVFSAGFVGPLYFSTETLFGLTPWATATAEQRGPEYVLTVNASFLGEAEAFAVTPAAAS